MFFAGNIFKNSESLVLTLKHIGFYSIAIRSLEIKHYLMWHKINIKMVLFFVIVLTTYVCLGRGVMEISLKHFSLLCPISYLLLLALAILSLVLNSFVEDILVVCILYIFIILGILYILLHVYFILQFQSQHYKLKLPLLLFTSCVAV